MSYRSPTPLPAGTGAARDVLDVLSDPPPRATPPPAPTAPDDLPQQLEALVKQARDLMALDNHSGAMELITKAVELSPGDPVVQQLKEKSETFLVALNESKLGRLDARPRILLRPEEIIWLKLDHRAGFVLAQVDGQLTYEDLLSVCGMSRLDTLRILVELVGNGVIGPSGG